MSRTYGHGSNGQPSHKTDRGGWEGFDSKRPMRWCGFGKWTKQKCHRIERLINIQTIKEELNLLE